MHFSMVSVQTNNLNLLRAIFAIQVVVVHVMIHMNLSPPRVLAHFPGVPAFFFVSGFLIYKSYCHAGGRTYFENRFLRLFPALAFVTLGGVLVALVAHGARDLIDHFPTYLGWVLAQVTLGQAWNPDLFRDIGVGVINGSLWTITTEILFYLAVPIIVWLERRFRPTVIVLTALSFAVFALGPWLLQQPVGGKTVFDFLALTPIVWGWMFGFGILAAKHFDRLTRWIRFFPLAIVPMLLMERGAGPLFRSTDNTLGLFYFTGYAALILWAAFGLRPVPFKPDFSYGIYVWHMPVINLLLVLAIPSPALALVLTGAMAALSWFAIERPALRLKRSSLKPVDGDVAATVAAKPSAG